MSSLRANRLFDDRTFAGREMKGQSHDFERQQQIGEDNGGVDAEDLGGGDGHLRGQRRLLANFQQRMLLAHGPVLSHVASGLAHEPYRRAVDRLRLAGAHKDGIRGGHELLNVAFLGGNVLRPEALGFVRD